MLTVTYAQCHIQALYAACCSAECRYAECPNTECHGAVEFKSKTVSLVSLNIHNFIYYFIHKITFLDINNIKRPSHITLLQVERCKCKTFSCWHHTKQGPYSQH